MFTAKDTGGGGDWEPVPAGVYHGVCYAVVDLGHQFSQMFGVEQHKCWICWELPDSRIDVEVDGQMENKPRVISKFFTVSLHEKSNLRQILESWRGRAFTKDELSGFDISKLFGVNGQINVIHKPKANGGMKADIGSIMPLARGMVKKDAENEYIYFSFEDHGLEITDNVPDGIKAMIMKSREWNEQGQNPLADSDPWRDNAPPPDDSDIPF